MDGDYQQNHHRTMIPPGGFLWEPRQSRQPGLGKMTGSARNGVPLKGSPRNRAEVSMLNVCVADDLMDAIRPTGVHTPSAQVPGRVQNFHWARSLKARWILMIWRIIYCYNSLWLRFHVFFIISTIMNCFGDVFLMFLSCAFIRWHIMTSPI
jgi:hypothetical protein